MTTTIIQNLGVHFQFPVIFTRGALEPSNRCLSNLLASAGPEPHRVAAVLDGGAARSTPDLAGKLETCLTALPEASLSAPVLIVPGGEQAKADLDVFRSVLDLIFEARLCRQSFLIVLGGGAVLDAAGFAAATAHRGVRLIRMPSTALAQNDAGVGVKNAVNFFGRKNFLGCFAPPYAVLNDFSLLDSLSPRHRRAGLAEAVKISLIKDAAFFHRLHRERHALERLEQATFEHSIVRCAELHLEHIATGGDPFEFGSSRPLDFGHWSAHALEEATDGGLCHGEAVAVGVALDSIYSHLLGLLPEAELELILEILPDLGFAPWHPQLETLDMPACVEAFREHLGGRLSMSMLTGIGSRLEIHDMDYGLMGRAAAYLKDRFA